MHYASEQGILNAQWNAAELACRAYEQQARPSVLYRPAIYIDGDMWCALYGEDLQAGVAGFGESPEKAMADFDANWVKDISAKAHNTQEKQNEV